VKKVSAVPAQPARFTLRAGALYRGYDESVGVVVARRLVAGRQVGDLEGEVLELLWLAADWLSGREVWERLGDESRAYTTVMTILSRLVDKGLVERQARGRGHVYRAAGDRDELTARAISSLLAATADPRVALAHFVEALDDPALVAELAELLERVRRS
jgi:predicted transcriptional regulator